MGDKMKGEIPRVLMLSILALIILLAFFMMLLFFKEQSLNYIGIANDKLIKGGEYV